MGWRSLADHGVEEVRCRIVSNYIDNFRPAKLDSTPFARRRPTKTETGAAVRKADGEGYGVWRDGGKEGRNERERGGGGVKVGRRNDV